MKLEIVIGQVWKEKDKRFTRYVRIDSLGTKNNKPAAWCLRCDSQGKDYFARDKITRIKFTTLQSRFELISQ